MFASIVFENDGIPDYLLGRYLRDPSRSKELSEEEIAESDLQICSCLMFLKEYHVVNMSVRNNANKRREARAQQSF